MTSVQAAGHRKPWAEPLELPTWFVAIPAVVLTWFVFSGKRYAARELRIGATIVAVVGAIFVAIRPSVDSVRAALYADLDSTAARVVRVSGGPGRAEEAEVVPVRELSSESASRWRAARHCSDRSIDRGDRSSDSIWIGCPPDWSVDAGDVRLVEFNQYAARWGEFDYSSTDAPPIGWTIAAMVITMLAAAEIARMRARARLAREHVRSVGR